MNGLLQVGISHPDGDYVTSIAEMRTALVGSNYHLDEEQTILNDGIAMIITQTESEAYRMMEQGTIILPSGYIMEIPTT